MGILIYRAKQADENLIELKTTRFDSLLDSTTETEDWFDNATISDYPTYSTGAVSSSNANIIYVSEPTQMMSDKPLVCADFRPHPHAHRTHFLSVRRTHSHPIFCSRMRNRKYFFKKLKKKISFIKIEKMC